MLKYIGLIGLVIAISSCGDNGESSSSSSGGVIKNTIPELPADPNGLKTKPINPSQAKSVSRLTNRQYVKSVEALVGGEAVFGIRPLLSSEVSNGGYSNAGYAQGQTFELINGLDAAAQKIVSNITDWPALHADWGGCTNYSCANTFIRAFAASAFRRPLGGEEVQALHQIVDMSMASRLSYDEAVGLLIRAILQAPEFLYLIEGPSLSEYELAARLSYFMTDGPPDDELRAATASLLQPGMLEAQFDRLLPQFAEGFGRSFIYDYLTLRRAYQRTFGPNDDVTGAVVESAIDTFVQLIKTGQSIDGLLTTTNFELNNPTRQLLAGAFLKDGETADTPPTVMGLLTHPGTLLAISNSIEGSTVSRGLFLQSDVLCLPSVPPPSAGLLTAELPLPENPTQRDEAEARLKDQRCSACHTQFEVFSFGLNHWGGDGVFKADPRLVDDGVIDSPLGTLSFGGYQDYLPLLAQSTQFQQCLTSQMIRYSLRHDQYPSSLINVVLNEASGSGQLPTFISIARAIIQNPIFSER